MITNKLNEYTHEVIIYDWVNLHDDYVCGHIKKDINADQDSELSYWMFYPLGLSTPINAGDLKRISEFTASLNGS